MSFFPISDTCSDLMLRRQTAWVVQQGWLWFFPSADPVGRHTEYATKTQTEEKLGDTWQNNHHSALIFKRESDNIQEEATKYGSQGGSYTRERREGKWGRTVEKKMERKQATVERKECSKTWRDKRSLLFPVDTFRSSASVPNSLCLR